MFVRLKNICFDIEDALRLAPFLCKIICVVYVFLYFFDKVTTLHIYICRTLRCLQNYFFV